MISKPKYPLINAMDNVYLTYQKNSNKIISFDRSQQTSRYINCYCIYDHN